MTDETRAPLPESGTNPLLSHECGSNMRCSICGSLPIKPVSATQPLGKGDYAWIKEACELLRAWYRTKDGDSSEAFAKRIADTDSLLSGVPCEQEDLGFDSPADRAVRSTSGLSTEDAARLEAMTKATYSHVDGRDLLHQLQPNGAHHIDIVVRINGEDRRYEGDWLKTLTHARDGHNMGEYADNPKLRAHIEAARADAGDSKAGEASGALSATGTTTKEKT